MTAKEIYLHLLKSGLTSEGACALMGNLNAESGLRANNAENGRTSLSDDDYTAAVDNGTYTAFVTDAIGYGLAQWTYWSRKQSLLAYAKARGCSIGDCAMQLDFCLKEIKEQYHGLFNWLCSTKDLEQATADVCTLYEKPAVNNIETRCRYAKQFYAEFVNSSEKEEAELTKNEAIAKLVACAKNQVGYLEKRSNAQLDDKTANAGSNNWNKYARDIDNKYPNFYNGRKNGYSWCDIFVDWCFIECFGYENALKMLYQPTKSAGAGCTYSANYYRAHNAFYRKPQVGDQVFFGDYGNEGHTGIVVAVSGNIITTVEGNTSGGYGVDANGDGVYLKQYNISTQYIPGFGRPNWGVVSNNVGKEEGSVTVSYPTIKVGSKGSDVKKAQQLLIAKGYSCGAAGADGDFGAGTYNAVKKFQADNDLEADGIVGANTWAALLKTEQPKPEQTKPEQTEPEKPAEPTGSACIVDLPIIRQGDNGFPVIAVQTLLGKHNFNVNYIDGDFGPDTLAKLKAFQKAKGLDADGIVGRNTWTKLLTNK